MVRKRLASAAFAFFAFFCSAFVTQSYLNRVTAAPSQEQKELAKQATSLVQSAYPELMKIVAGGARNEELEAFVKKYMDLQSIAKTICKAPSKDLEESLIKYFIALFKLEAIQKVRDYELNRKMRVIDGQDSIKVISLLKSKKNSEDDVKMVMSMPKKTGNVEKFNELEIMSISLVRGAKVVVDKYCVSRGLEKNKDNAIAALNNYASRNQSE